MSLLVLFPERSGISDVVGSIVLACIPMFDINGVRVVEEAPRQGINWSLADQYTQSTRRLFVRHGLC